MTALPAGWKEVPLPDALFFQEGPGLRSFQFRDAGIPFLNIRTFQNGRIDRSRCQFLDPVEVEKKYRHFLLNEDDIVCSTSGTIGKVATITKYDLPLMLNTSVVRFRPHDNKQVDRGWIRLFLQTDYFLKQARGAATGSAQVNFGPSHLRKMSFVLPPPTEQRRIVAEIEKQFTRLEAGVAALRRVQANLHRYRAAVLKAACEGRLVPTEAGKWRRVSLAQLGKWCGGGTPSKANPKFWTNGKIPWVSPKDMKVPVIADAEDHITKEAVENSATNLLPKGSVLVVTRSGILQHTLPVAVCAREVAINQDLKALQPSADFISRYVAVALKGHEQELLHTCTKTGTTVQNIEFPVFMRFEIDVPPLAEQERIVAEVERRLSVVAELAAVVEANLKRATRLRQSVLQKAFTGELV